ncbi:flagellar biosynthetic protein FliR, partial [Vibrio parahaemolyticus]|nr:flagellar biosynthetic protein FliR [Vibrio parahaemolyticus]
MEYHTQIILDWISNYFWPYVRISSMLMVINVTGARFVSPRNRLYLGHAITFAVMP